MSELADRITAKFEKLKQKRDELQVQLDLGKMEAADAWNALDERWGEVETKVREIEQQGQEAAEDIQDAAELLLDEIREGFEKLRKLI